MLLYYLIPIGLSVMIGLIQGYLMSESLKVNFFVGQLKYATEKTKIMIQNQIHLHQKKNKRALFLLMAACILFGSVIDRYKIFLDLQLVISTFIICFVLWWIIWQGLYNFLGGSPFFRNGADTLAFTFFERLGTWYVKLTILTAAIIYFLSVAYNIEFSFSRF